MENFTLIHCIFYKCKYCINSIEKFNCAFWNGDLISLILIDKRIECKFFDPMETI